MTNWGSIIINAYKKSQPILLDGTTKIFPRNSKFSLQNPFILEVLPDELIKSASIFEGKKLNTVCRVIDNPATINRYKTFCNYFNRQAKTTPNCYLANLYRNVAPNKTKPEIYLDFAKRAETNEFKGIDLYRKILDSEYDVLRRANYDLSHISQNISDITSRSTSKITVLNQNGWHYRQLQNAPKFSAKYRISINAEGNPKVIEAMDEFVNAERYYKTPDLGANWLERHDPITVYFKNKPTDTEIKELVAKLKRCNGIRSTENSLIGEQIFPGVALQKSPGKQETLEIIRKCYNASPDFGKAVEQYLTNLTTKDVKASAGQITAIENILKNVLFV